MDKADKICMISLGCAKNLVDSEILIGGLRQEKYEIVAITGNSMGWYSALALSGALTHENAYSLISTMGSMMKEGTIGGQIIY